MTSFIIFTQHKKQTKFSCPNCLDKAHKKALTKTILLGWWGIPWGIIRTVQAIRINLNCKKTNHSEVANDYLRNFILSKIGQFETYKGNTEKLEELISTE